MTNITKKDDYNRRFGERLYNIRSIIGLNQEDFSTLLKVNYPRYQTIESGNTVNDLSVFIWIVDHIKVFFGIEVVDLINNFIDEDKFRTTVQTNWSYYQDHKEVINNLIPDNMFQIISIEQKIQLRNERNLIVRKDAKKVYNVDNGEKRIFISVLLGERIKFIRQSIHENQTHLANSLCISEDRISSLERGETLRSFSILIRLLLIFQRLDVSLYDLISINFDRVEIKKRVLAARSRNQSRYVIADSSILVNSK